MMRLGWLLLYGKYKKYRVLLLCVAVCLFFTMTVDTLYRGYCDAQIENAYDYGGRWDVSIRLTGNDLEKYQIFRNDAFKFVGMNTVTYSLQLDSVPEENRNGLEYISYYYLSLLGIQNEEQNALSYKLKEGRWPENDSELVVPYTMVFDGRSAKNGSLNIGDVINFEYGRRVNAEGEYTQKQVVGAESFVSNGQKCFTICGFIDYADYTSDKYVLYGYTGLNDGFDIKTEEVVLYYELLEKTLVELDKAYHDLSEMEGVLEVSKNSFIESALMVLENSDYLRAVRYGLYLLEGILILVGICIAGANQYQGILEERKQIGLLCGMGAEKRQIYFLYCINATIVILIGFLAAFVFYYGLVGVVRASILSEVRNMFFKTNSFSPNVEFCAIALLAFWIILTGVTVVTLHENISLYKIMDAQGKKKKICSEVIKNIRDLAKNNLQQRRFRRLIQQSIMLLILMFTPICVLFAWSTYEKASKISRNASADFYMLKSGYSDDLDECLNEIPYIKLIIKKIGGNRLAYIPAEYLGAEVVEQIKTIYATDIAGSTYQPFTENNEYDCTMTVVFVDEKNYERLEELNPGELPKYEDFCNGNNGLLYAQLTMPSTGEKIDVGKRVADNMDSITYYSFINTELSYTLDIIGSIGEIDTDSAKGSLMMTTYVPLELYDELKMDMHTSTSYWIDGYKGSIDLLGENLKELAYQYDYHLQDNISESSAKKDALIIQASSIFSVIVVVLIMSISAMGVMVKLEYLERKEIYGIYKMLGLDKRGAGILYFLEQIIPLLDVILVGAFLHCLFYYMLLKDLYVYYSIELSTVAIAFIVCACGVVLILVMNTKLVTRKKYREKLL